MKAITVIRREHRDLGMTLMSFESLLKGINNKKQEPDSTFFRAILGYLDSFLNRFHHPKEDDYLFPALLERQAQGFPTSIATTLPSRIKKG